MNMKTYELIVSGRVQGVGYRANVMKIANNLGFKGNVRNLSNGDVKVIVQTNEDQLEIVKNHLSVNRHPVMKINSIQVNEIQVEKNYQDFKIIY